MTRPNPKPPEPAPVAAGSQAPAGDLEDRFPGLAEAVRAGFAELDSGQRIPLEDVGAWVESWGTADEKPMPVPGPAGTANR